MSGNSKVKLFPPSVIFFFCMLFLLLKQWGEFESILNYQPCHCLFINPFMCVTDLRKNPHFHCESSGQDLRGTVPGQRGSSPPLVPVCQGISINGEAYNVCELKV